MLSGLLFDLVFAYDDHLFSVPVSCAEYGRRQRSQLRLVGMRACNDRMGGAEKARAPGSARGVAEAVRSSVAVCLRQTREQE